MPVITAQAKRLSTSKNGNPRFVVQFDDTDYLTETDGQVGYKAENFNEGDEVEVTFTNRSRTIVKDIRLV